ncbi:MAG: hypothetical protein CMQ21_05760 [Gammaproteobacteria bacterium]|nr:hypothetical protein [Gammaproteobacteria bacterium]
MTTLVNFKTIYQIAGETGISDYFSLLETGNIAPMAKDSCFRVSGAVVLQRASVTPIGNWPGLRFGLFFD